MPRHQLTDEDRVRGGKSAANRPAPEDCDVCQRNGYTGWMQHLGHKGLATLMETTPEYGLWVRKRIRAYNRNHGRPPHHPNAPKW